MKYVLAFLVILLLILAAHAAAIAGPGDPRLVSGILEWPLAVTNEPFVVVRGDDGVLYYVTITSARRDATLAAGARLAVLGFEGRAPHEINALGVGAGDSIESALANLQGAPAAPTASTPAVVTPTIAVAPTTPSASAPAATAHTAPANGGAAAIAAPSIEAPNAAQTPSAPAPTITTPAPAVTPITPGIGPYPSVISAPTGSPVRSAAVSAPTPRPPVTEVTTPPAAVPVSASDDRRWTEVTGVVESLVGRTLVLRSQEGRIAVDVSALSANLERIVAPGATVRVYGVPLEMRFKAMGLVNSEARP
jgi:hypothetical protein